MESKKFNIYEDFSKLNVERLKEAANSLEWPKGKRYTVNLNGKEFKIQTYFTKATEKVPGYGFDAYTAIESMFIRQLTAEEIMWEHNGEPQYADPEFDKKKCKYLEPADIKQRTDFIVAVANLINNQETMEAIVASAAKKKNGTLHINRVVKIASSGIADDYDRVFAIVARAKTDLSISITFEDVLCRPGDNELWANDFISTYHDGLLVSEALKAATE